MVVPRSQGVEGGVGGKRYWLKGENLGFKKLLPEYIQQT